MKICHNCGAVLADNEPYCENCSFDPSFDFDSWQCDGPASSGKPYLHGDHIKSPPKSQNDLFDTIVGLFLLAVLILAFLAYLDMYNWDIGRLIWDNLESIFTLIIVIAVCGVACNYFNNL